MWKGDVGEFNLTELKKVCANAGWLHDKPSDSLSILYDLCIVRAFSVCYTL